MPRRKGKGVGKVVKVRRRKVRARLRLPSVRVLAIAIAAVLAPLIALYAYNASLGGGSVARQLSPHETIKLLALGNASAVLVYDVSGNLPLSNGTVLNVYDKVIFIVQPSTLGSSAGSSDAGAAGKRYLIRYEASPYLSHHLMLRLGIPLVAEDLKNLFADLPTLELVYTNISSRHIGKGVLNSRVLGTVSVNVYEVTYDSITLVAYCDATYGVPVEVRVALTSLHEVRLVLSGLSKL